MSELTRGQVEMQLELAMGPHSTIIRIGAHAKLLNHDAALRAKLAEVEQESESRRRVMDDQATLLNTYVQRVAELEQALRLHLAVSPDDPILLTPIEQQLVAVTQERDEARAAATTGRTNAYGERP